MKLPASSGMALAAAAASLVMASATIPSSVQAASMKGHCVGANSCKGQSACKSASNQCKGLNSCKGKGFLEMTKSACSKIKGAKFVAAM
jgi:hypothetical protein